MKILIVGQNPKTEINVKYPFVGTRSVDVLRKWLVESNIPTTYVHLTNASSKVGKVTYKDMELGSLSNLLLEHDAVIYLGRYAQRAGKVLSQLHPIPTLNLPHPSGLNRSLNGSKVDPIKMLKDFYKDLHLFSTERRK